MDMCRLCNSSTNFNWVMSRCGHPFHVSCMIDCLQAITSNIDLQVACPAHNCPSMISDDIYDFWTVYPVNVIRDSGETEPSSNVSPTRRSSGNPNENDADVDATYLRLEASIANERTRLAEDELRIAQKQAAIASARVRIAELRVTTRDRAASIATQEEELRRLSNRNRTMTPNTGPSAVNEGSSYPPSQNSDQLVPEMSLEQRVPVTEDSGYVEALNYHEEVEARGAEDVGLEDNDSENSDSEESDPEEGGSEESESEDSNSEEDGDLGDSGSTSEGADVLRTAGEPEDPVDSLTQWFGSFG